jgi:Suppressor of fused protein (SUFU)
MQNTSEDDDWEEIWDARVRALESVLGPCHDQVLHAPVPFYLGGRADVVVFLKHLDGAVYVTSDLSGKPDASYADYELMVCHRSPQDWGPRTISSLALYTQEAYIGAGESMDLDPATPADSEIKAFIFDTYDRFTLFEQEFELRLCLGITKAELQFKMECGSERLLALLRAHRVYPFTDLGRSSVPLNES